MPPDSMIKLADSAFSRVLAAAGVPPSLFVDGADGTAQREACVGITWALCGRWRACSRPN